MSYQPFVWSEDSVFGIDDIDAEHKRLYDLGNEILALPPEAPREEMLRKIDELGNFAFLHFETEKRILGGKRLPQAGGARRGACRLTQGHRRVPGLLSRVVRIRRRAARQGEGIRARLAYQPLPFR